MYSEKFFIDKIPCVTYGEKTNKIFLFVHGQSGNKEEAERFAEIAEPFGYCVVGVDLPSHGEREKTDNFYPWVAVPELQKVYDFLTSDGAEISVRANSIGAWFSMIAFENKKINEYLFVSPVVDMKNMIDSMMSAVGVSEEQLEKEKIIETPFGQPLMWQYYLYAQEHRAKTNCKTKVLYGEKDTMVMRSDVECFCEKNNAPLTVMPDGEHWFHTERQVEFLSDWEKSCLIYE